MGILYDNSLTAFVVTTLILGGGASWLTGRAIARNWGPVWQVVFYAALLALPVRFLHYSLANGTLLSLQLLLTDTFILIAVGLLSYRLSQTTAMVSQYPWRYERTGPLTWSRKE